MNTQTTLGPRPRSGRASARAASGTQPVEVSAVRKVANDTIEQLCEVFKMLSDASRLKILIALAQNGRMHVTALKDLLKQSQPTISQPAVSHHLSLMRHTKLVRCDRRGKNNFYCLDSTQMTALLEQFFGQMGDGAKQISFDDFALTFKRK